MCLFSLLCCCCYYCYSFFDKCLLDGVAPSASFHVLRRVEPNGRAQSHENCTKREHTNTNLEVAIFTKIQPHAYMCECACVCVYNDPTDILNRTHARQIAGFVYLNDVSTQHISLVVLYSHPFTLHIYISSFSFAHSLCCLSVCRRGFCSDFRTQTLCIRVKRKKDKKNSSQTRLSIPVFQAQTHTNKHAPEIKYVLL